MKRFLKDLGRKLVFLRKKERNRYIESYKESILDKIEHGATEQEAVLQTGNQREIAKEVLESYRTGKRLDFEYKYVNPVFLYADMLAVFVAYMISVWGYAYVYAEGGVKRSFGAGEFIWGTVTVAVQLLVYLLYGLYSLDGVVRVQIVRILLSNLTGAFLLSVVAYVTGCVWVSRRGLIICGMVSGIGQILIRKLIVKQVSID